MNGHWWGTPGADILVVCDAPNLKAYQESMPMGRQLLKQFAATASSVGLTRDDMMFVGLCPPVRDADKNSQKRKWAHVEPYVDALRDYIEAASPKLVITMGELASRAVLGRAVKITKARGMVVVHEGGKPPTFPMLSPAFVNRIPDHRSVFDADIHMVSMLKQAGYDPSQIDVPVRHYEWRTDISDLLGDNKSAVISVDTETTGLTWWRRDVVPLTVQISTGPGRSVVCPVDRDYYPDMNARTLTKLKRQLRELLEDTAVRKIGQNIKYDHHILRKLGIECRGWLHDTQLMAFGVDENLISKKLEDLVKVFVPDMAGYSDEFDRKYDKANMRAVPHDDMLDYAGGDPDATFRLAQTLRARLTADARQVNCYRRIQMPAIQVFQNMVEPFGMRVDRDKLREFGTEVRSWLRSEQRMLMRIVPGGVKRKHLDDGKKLSFGRKDFLVDLLYDTQIGFGLIPTVWTKSTSKLPMRERVPSTSTKDQLPYFVTDDRVITGTDVTVGTFVLRLIDYLKITKLHSTFIGEEQNRKGVPTGMWKYLDEHGVVRPSYNLHITNTGRTSSNNPNGQNFPQRGKSPLTDRLAKGHQGIFIPRDGYKFVSVDLSQIELRLVAWMSGEPEMRRIYAEGGDIHMETAAYVMGISSEQFAELPPEVQKQKRFQAKAINFGFIYGMGWRKFRVYAKTDYGLDFTDEQAEYIREAFFRKYPGLLDWHDRMREFVQAHGFVRALHGAVRHLPSVFSDDRGISSAATRYAVNSPIQRFASDIGLIGMARFAAQVDPSMMRILGFIHDAVVMEVREDVAEEGAAALKWCMEGVPLFDWFNIDSPVPILADASIGDNGGEMEEQKTLQAIKPEWWRDDEDAAWGEFIQRGDAHAYAMAA